MTARTMSVLPPEDTRLRPLPWHRMAWVNWRQHRVALAGVALLLGVVAVYLWFNGLQIHHAYAAYCHPPGALACTLSFTNRYGVNGIIVSVFLQALPALIGAFVGAPVLAREMETGTFRYAWTQGFGRRRWAIGKLVTLAVVLAAVTEAFGLLFSWYNRPFVDAGYVIPLSARVFDLLGVAFPAWTLAAFAIGALAGMLIRRVVPAIAATLVVYAGLAFATAVYLRQHYLAPLLTSKPNLPGSAWVVNEWFAKAGQPALPARGPRLVSTLRNLCPAMNTSPAQCLTSHGYVQWQSY